MENFKTVIPNQFSLPRRINRLGELAYNLWWTWNPDAQRIFARIDTSLWEKTQSQCDPVFTIGGSGTVKKSH